LVSLILVVVTTVLLGGLGWVFYTLDRNRELTHYRTDLSNDADRLATVLSVPVWNFDNEEIWMVLDSVFINRSIRVATLHVDASDYSMERVADGTVRKGIFASPQDGSVETRSISHNGLTLGTLTLYADPGTVLESSNSYLGFLLIVISILDVVLIVCLFVLIRVIVLKPLGALERYASEFDGTRDGIGTLDPAMFRGELAALRDSLAKMITLLQTRYEYQKNTEKRLSDLNFTLERRVKERTSELEMLNKELESFSYSVSHDLRAPLRAISGFTAALIEDCGMAIDSEERHKLDVIESNAKRMDSLIQGLLALSGVSRSGITFMRVDMTNAARQACDEVMDEAARKEFTVSIRELPPAWGDLVLLRQVFVNLVSNAVKYSKKSELKKIDVDGWVDGDSCVYRVADHGAGFDQAYSGKLFEAFQRLHSDREFEGTGVGLALVKRITLRHGGRVWALGEVGKGAEFFFSIPVKVAADGQKSEA
jgi:signal transduction histidine kinase